MYFLPIFGSRNPFEREHGRYRMRITDNRYTGEMEKFDLAVRMIGHEARTGTIRRCTGFTEDRIRKLYATYFRGPDGPVIKRRRGKSPRQISRFVNSSHRQCESTLLACLFIYCDAISMDEGLLLDKKGSLNSVALGFRLCQAFEAYLELYPDPQLSFEWAWNLHHALVETHELIFASCAGCRAPYVQDAYALDYRRCPVCELKDQHNLADRV